MTQRVLVVLRIPASPFSSTLLRSNETFLRGRMVSDEFYKNKDRSGESTAKYSTGNLFPRKHFYLLLPISLHGKERKLC